jgi:N-acetylglucosaminyldiphosphoundecaprenol N-acetyl-beta-D-mannosaminyltransferase
VIDRLIAKLSRDLPQLNVAYHVSPPFGATEPGYDTRIAEEINASGARIVFVGLGCPKQEAWMARQRGEVRGVMIGVGAAFDFLAGVKPQAPARLQRIGMEWLFRLVTEPRRLGKRYLRQNPRFVVLFSMQLVRARTGRHGLDDTMDQREAA